MDAELTVSSLPLLAMTSISSPIYVLAAGSGHSFLRIGIKRGKARFISRKLLASPRMEEEQGRGEACSCSSASVYFVN